MREALAEHRLADFVRQEEGRGVELANGSELERALALLITKRRVHVGPLHPPLSGLSFARHRPAVESRHFCQSPDPAQSTPSPVRALCIVKSAVQLEEQEDAARIH